MARPAVNPVLAAPKAAADLRKCADDLTIAARAGDLTGILAAARKVEAIGCSTRRAAAKAGG